MFNNNVGVAEDMLSTFLARSIPKFYNCVKDIRTTDMTSGEFPCELDLEEKNILAELMVLSWLDWVINDIRQMNIHLNDNDWRRNTTVISYISPIHK